MKIERLQVDDFMLFEQADITWSKNINVICGSNSTGKTALLKLMYSLLYAYCQSDTKGETKEKIESRFVEKLTHVFRTEDMQIGRLARRKQGSSHASGTLNFSSQKMLKFGFGNRAVSHMELEYSENVIKTKAPMTTVYFPPKEIISSTENFRSLYEDMHIAFEEPYYDLARLLDRPLKKGKNTDEQNQVLNSLGNILGGTIVQRENKFYLKIAGQGEFEMGLVSEGYRKLATIVYLVLNGSLSANSVLFWDQPETNMNPAMIQPLVTAIMQLAKLGVQVFLTTHDYFLQQYFNMYMAYPESNPDQIEIQFVSLYRDDEEKIVIEKAHTIDELRHNTIMEEFDRIYDREQGFLYGDTGEPA